MSILAKNVSSSTCLRFQRIMPSSKFAIRRFGPRWAPGFAPSAVLLCSLFLAPSSAAALLLPAPTLSAPANGATGQSTTPTFSWSSVTGANRYWLTVATSSASLPTDPSAASCPGCVISCSTTSTSHTAGGSCTVGQSTALAQGTTYYWRVQAYNTNGTQGNYSSIRQFTTQSALLPAPTPLSPANGATGQSTTPTFTWSSVTGANRYWLTVATSSASLPADPSAASCPGCVISCSTTSTSHTAGGSCTGGQSTALAQGTTYYWRVQAYNTNGTQGNYSSIRQFTTQSALLPAPTPLSPANGATGQSTTPTFTWSSVTGANRYWLTVATSSGTLPTDPSTETCPGCVISCSTTTTSHTAGGSCTVGQSTALAQGTTYYWRVQAYNTNGTQGNYSSIRQFTTQSALLPAPTPLSPANGATGQPTTPTFTWSSVTGANRYWLTVATSSGTLPTDPSTETCPGCVISCSTTTTSHTAGGSCTVGQSTALAQGTTYYWRVQAYNTNGTQGNYSSIRQFTTQSALLPAPTPLSPANGATGQSTTPTFTWSSVTGANRYWLTVATSSGTLPTDPSTETCPGCVISCSTTTTSHAAAGSCTLGQSTALAEGTTYYWRVQAYNNTNGTQGNYSSISNFVVTGNEVDIQIDPLSLQFYNPPQQEQAQGPRTSRARTESPTRADGDEVTVFAAELGSQDLAEAVTEARHLSLKGLLLEGDSATSDLELERFEVWRPDAVIEVSGKQVPVPTTLYFKGTAVGYPGSSALLFVRKNGDMKGLILRADGAWAIGRWNGQATIETKKADLSELSKTFLCGIDQLRTTAGRALEEQSLHLGGQNEGQLLFEAPFTATVAIETDYEYYETFLSNEDPTAAALDYTADLIGYADLVYSREIDTDLTIGFARLWDGGANSDPWAPASSTGPALSELEEFWNGNMSWVNRTVVLMLSGKDLGGGLAAGIGVLCDSYAHPGASDDYSIAGDISGAFNWDANQAVDPASMVFDIYVVAHELGHTFNSPHTQQYCGLGGSSEPIDRCDDGCAGPGTGLPSCSSSPPFFDGGAGTIMSYCHRLTGGINNISMTFGQGHTCGVLPEREAYRMAAYVASRASGFPSCFQPPGNSFTIYNDGGSSATISSIDLESSAPWITWTPFAPFAIPAGGSESVTVNVDFSKAPAGQSVRRILVSSNDPDKSPYPGGINIIVNQQATPECFRLIRSHSGSGEDPVVMPSSSAGCPAGEYLGGQSIQLTAAPDAGWEVESWSGTSDDGSSSTTNLLVMPQSEHTVSVTYVQTAAACYTLTRTHSGAGSDPIASPVSSTGCPSNQFSAGADIALSATPNPGWRVGSWSGTSNDNSTVSTNSVMMPSSDHAVWVSYSFVPQDCAFQYVNGLEVTGIASYEACDTVYVSSDVSVRAGGGLLLSGGRLVAIGNGFVVEGSLRVSSCGHDLCVASAAPIENGCHSCVSLVCDVDPRCCSTSWNSVCVSEVGSICALSCP